MKLFNNSIRGNRKFTVALLSLTMSFVLALLGKITGDNWVWVVGAILALFGAANAFVHYTGAQDGPDQDS